MASLKHQIAACFVTLLAAPAVWSSSVESHPAVDVPAQFDQTSASTSPLGSLHSEWWNRFGDPELNVLIQRALKENLDVVAATARISAARARRGITDARFVPQTSLESSASREKRSENAGYPTDLALADTQTYYRSVFEASWEIDLFGARAATRRESAAELAAVSAERDAVRLLVATETATLYVEHALLAQRLQSAQRELAHKQQMLTLIMQQHEIGEASRDLVSEARRSVEAAAAFIPYWEAETEARKYAMGTLLGTGGYVDLPRETPILGAISQPVRTAADEDVGLPSDLLRRRPDLRRAEAEWQEAQAARDVAIADQYPRFSLVGGLGRESIQSGSLLDAASRVWSLGPQLSLPVFDGGRRKTTVAMRTAEMDAAAADYKQAVLTAIGDVEQAIMRYQAARSSMTSTLASLTEAQDVLGMEEQRYAAGDTALVEVLAARARFETDVSKSLDAKQQALLSFIGLNKALGGGLP